MNERIQELARQAGILIDWGEDIKVGRWGIGGKYENMQKFAELIVKECMKVALDERVSDEEIDKSDDIEDRCYLRGNNGGVVDAVVAIKQQFGVEE